MAKFQIGDIIVNRNGVKAKVHDLNIFTAEYVLTYIDVSTPNFAGLHTYAVQDIDDAWTLESKMTILPSGNSQGLSFKQNRVSVKIIPDIDLDEPKKCTCGVHTTYGKSVHVSFHSSYCDLIRKTA